MFSLSRTQTVAVKLSAYPFPSLFRIYWDQRWLRPV